MKRFLTIILSISVLTSVSFASYNYGTNVQGTTVTYNTIDADSDLWGNMQVNGNDLWFFPTDFQAEAQNGGNQTVDGTLQFNLESKPGGGTGSDRFIESIQFLEFGHYSLIDNLGNGTDLTNATVTCDLIITVQEINREYVSMAPIFDSLTFTQSGGDFDLLNDGATAQSAWQGILNHDFLAQDGLSQVTKVQVSINNLLTVTSEDGTVARIEKKGLGESPSVSISPTIEVPEPATLAMLALGGLFFRKRK